MLRLSYLLFLVVVGEVREISFEPVIVNPSKVIEREHHFSFVYEQIRSHEGGYVFHPNDKGGQTYGGIARRVHPKWRGWQIIDQVPNKKRYDIIPQAEFWVKDFYLDLWVKGGYEVIENRELALNLFDFAIHSSPRTVDLKVNRVLKKLGCDQVRVQGEWVDDRFNRVPPTEFIFLLKIERLKLFNYLVTKDSSQLVFYSGWLKRIENI